MATKRKPNWLVIRDGQVKLSLVAANCRIVNGKLECKTDKGYGPIVDGTLAGQEGQLDAIKAMQSAGRWADIPDRYKGGPGESPSGMLIIPADEWEARQLADRQIKVTRDGKVAMQHDARDPIQANAVVTLCGFDWRVTGQGKPFASHLHTCRYAYLVDPTVATGADLTAAYAELIELASDEDERASRAFNRMMDDEDNDGVRMPARSQAGVYRDLAKRLADHNDRLPVYRKAQRQAESDPSTTTGCYMCRCGERALELLAAGADLAAVEAALVAYQSDPDYLNAVAGM